MAISLLYVCITAVVLWFTYLYIRLSNLRKKLSWVPAAPRYPLVGNAFDLVDSTKSLYTVQNYLCKFNGVCYIELLFRPVILISDYKLVEWLLTSSTMLTKAKEYNFLFNWLEGGLIISTGPIWKKSRKILTPAFHFAILERMVDVFEERGAVLINKLRNEVGKDEVDIYSFITRYTLDVICQTSMGTQLNVQEGGHKDYFNAVGGMCKIAIERGVDLLKMSDLTYRFTSDYAKEQSYVKLLHEVSDNIINERRKEIANKSGQEEDDKGIGARKKMAFLDLLLKYRDENGQPLSHSFIRHEVDTFLFAGHDTTAAAISFTMYCLAKHPEVQAQALAEIKEVLEGKSKITFQDLQEMKYLEAVVKESLRVYPPVPFFSRLMTEDVVYKDGNIIPKGVTITVAAYSVNMNPDVFENPEQFNPSRFLDTTIKPFSYLPFSAGPRNCIGQKFAMLEIKSTVSEILLNYEVLPTVPEHKLILAAEVVLKSRNGVKVRLRKRM